jgi:hypothetical protein
LSINPKNLIEAQLYYKIKSQLIELPQEFKQNDCLILNWAKSIQICSELTEMEKKFFYISENVSLDILENIKNDIQHPQNSSTDSEQEMIFSKSYHSDNELELDQDLPQLKS